MDVAVYYKYKTIVTNANKSLFLKKNLRNNCHVTLVSGVQHNELIFVYVAKRSPQ